MNATRYRVIDSPVGPITLGGDRDALTHLRMEDQTHAPAGRDSWVSDDHAFPDVVAQLAAYFAGDLTEFDIEIRLEGTPFQRRVWAALRKIPFGTTESYVGALTFHPRRAIVVSMSRPTTLLLLM